MFRLLEKLSPLTAEQANNLARAVKRQLESLGRRETAADRELREGRASLSSERVRRSKR